jgi:Ca-activated chloride channel family protein
MKRTKKRLSLGVLLVAATALGLLVSTRGWFAQSQEQGDQQQQQEPQSSTGPKRPVGETVLVPKKTQPSPTTTAPSPAGPEKKPEKINPKDIFTLSTTTNLVNVDVMVLDNNGNPIGNLTQKNFKVFDDGVPQAITNFGTAEAPMTVCMLIEYSNKWWPFLYLALRYSYDFLNVMRPKDWVAVVSFDMKPQILTDFTQDRYQVRSALDTLRIPGFSETNLWDALAFVLDKMRDIEGRKAIVLICTGIDTFSKLTYGEALKIVRASDTTIYPVSILEFMSVRYGDSIDTLQARNALNTIAKYSGGQAYFPRFEAEIPTDYQQIAGQLRMQYSLGYMPTNPSKDGKFHKLKVEVVDAQGNQLRIVNQKGKAIKYRVVARDGYYAPKS